MRKYVNFILGVEVWLGKWYYIRSSRMLLFFSPNNNNYLRLRYPKTMTKMG